MLSNVYAIYDHKAHAFMQPFFAATNGLALRTFSDNANNPDTVFNRHPDDFELCLLSTFDDITGTFESAAEEGENGELQLKRLGLASDFITEQQ